MLKSFVANGEVIYYQNSGSIPEWFDAVTTLTSDFFFFDTQPHVHRIKLQDKKDLVVYSLNKHSPDSNLIRVSWKFKTKDLRMQSSWYVKLVPQNVYSLDSESHKKMSNMSTSLMVL